MLENSLCLRRAELPTALLMKLSYTWFPFWTPSTHWNHEPPLLNQQHTPAFFSHLKLKWSSFKPAQSEKTAAIVPVKSVASMSWKAAVCAIFHVSDARIRPKSTEDTRKTHWLWDLAALHTDLCSAGGSLPPSDVIGRHVGASRSKLTFSLTLVSSKTFKIVTYRNFPNCHFYATLTVCFWRINLLHAH